MSDTPTPVLLKETLDKCRSSVLGVAVFSLGINLLMLSVPLYMLQLVDRVIPNNSSDTLMLLTVLVVIAIVTLSALDAVRTMILARISAWVEHRLSGDVLGGSIVRSLKRRRTPSVRALRDLSTIRNFLTGPGLTAVLDAPWTPIFVLVVFMLHPMIGWITLIGSLTLFGLGVVNEILSRRLLNDAEDESTKRLDQAHAIARNADVIEAMGMRRDVISLWSEQNARSLALDWHSTVLDARISAVAKFLRFGLQIAILCVAAMLVIAGQMTMGAMIASVLLMRRAVAPMDRAIMSWKSVVRARAAYRQVRRRLQGVEEMAGGAPLMPPEGRLEVRSLTYYHSSSEKPVIKRLNFSLEPGNILGLVGSSGSGKTTLARLLLGNLEPYSGSVKLDDTEMSEWESGHRGRYVGFLPQDIELFAGTIRQNIARMTNGDPDDVMKAAMMAGVHDTISRFPDGYETEIGESGAILSGGQRQRIGLARALYGNPKFVVLDEPDSSLDREGRDALSDAILELQQRGTTVVLITHRPAMLRHCTKILVLPSGELKRIDEIEEKRLASSTSSRSNVTQILPGR